MNAPDLIEKLTSILGSVGHLGPELFVLITASILLITEIIFANRKLILKSSISLIGLIIAFGCLWINDFRGLLFSKTLILDDLAVMFEVGFLVITAMVILFPRKKEDLRKRGEYHFLLLALLIGAFVVVKSQNLIVFYLGIETISIASYILTTFGLEKKSYEAGIKYLLFGALASGVMLYGISLIYGFSGSLELEGMFGAMAFESSGLHHLAMIFLMSGVFFKLSMVPMHIWLPDVYESTPAPIITMFSTLPKLSVSVFLYRLIAVLGSSPMQEYLITIIVVMAILSMLIGNLSAIWQNDVKRLFGYSSIAHAGFLVIGLILGSEFGLQAFIFYASVYALMNVGVFYFIEVMESNGKTKVQDYSGLGRTFPWLAVVVVVLMVSLTGLPPTGGFTAKFMVFSALWERFSSSGNELFVWLFVIGLANTVVALFYYLKVPYYMVFKSSNASGLLNITAKDKIILAIIALSLLILFFKPDLLVNLTNKINFAF